jgi:glycosyltransferase involved in cell wall biosynthesis
VFKGWLGGAAVSELLAQSDLMLAPSRLETCGLALMEALAARCPVVAFDTPTHREVAGDAALYASDATAMIAQARQVLDSPSLASALSALGPSRVPRLPLVAAQWLHFWAQTR